MHNHFDKNLNVKELILHHKSQIMVECGAGSGENTVQLLSMNPVQLITISDGLKPTTGMFQIEAEKAGVPLGDLGRVIWITGVSWKEIPLLVDNYSDFCSIDTDHNYWTLKQELNAIHPKMKVGGIIVMHDTETYGKSSGKSNGYGVPVPYPGKEIEEGEKQGKGLVDAINEFLKEHSEYKIIRVSKDSHGATALLKGDKNKCE